MLSHLWSLAVEEQFYLIWPFVIIFFNKKYLLFAISLFIIIGSVSQHLLTKVPYGSILTISCFDAFGFGALLALVISYAKDRLNYFYKYLSIIALLVFSLFIVGVFYYWVLPQRTVISIISVWLITYVIVNVQNDTLRLKFLFNNKILLFLGKISYGLYLYHNIIPQLINSQIINKYFNPLLPDILFKKYWGQLYLVENTILLVLISWLSYSFFEVKFLKLKKYFIYGVPSLSTESKIKGVV
jgi:peptidoglycan/LPS O-acetylase OafA/YrhL